MAYHTLDSIGNIRSTGAGSGTNQYGLPIVDDPEKTFAQITRNQYLDFMREYSGFEDDLIKRSQTDTSLVDQAREDAAMAPALATGITERNTQRYGLGLTPTQISQRRKNIQLGSTLGGIQSVADARLGQQQLNKGILADLINIGQGVNQSAISTMGSAAQNAANRRVAYSRDRASAKANMYSTIGALGSAAIFMMAF